jgi:hypothetical protein
MAINPSAIASQNVQDNPVFALEILTTQPVAGEVFSPLRSPGQLVAWYNGSTERFELYVVNRAGNRFLKVVQ